MQTLTVVGKDTLDKLIELLRLSQVQPGYFEAVLDLKVGIPDPLRNHAALGDHILNVLLIVGQVQTWAHDSAGQLALLRPQHPQIIVQLPQLLLRLAVIPKGLLVELQHQMVIRTDLQASVLFLLLYCLRVQLVLHPVEHYRSVAFVVALCLSDEVADLGLDDSQAVIEPRLDEVRKLGVLDVGVFDNIFAFDKIFAGGAHIQYAYHFEAVLVLHFGQHFLDLLLLAQVVDHSDCESDLVNDFELRPIIREILSGEVKFLSAVLTQDEWLCVGVVLLARVAVVDGQLEVLIAKLGDLLLRQFGQRGDTFDENGDPEVVLQTFAVCRH